MDPNTYQNLCHRTECDQRRVASRIISQTAAMNDNSLRFVRLNHAIIGLTGEVGEIAGLLEKWIYYGQDLDEVELKSELGDCMWYIALACNAAGFSLEEILQANIAKLKVRYPDKYSDLLAAEKNRDRGKERKALTGCSHRWSTGSGGLVVCEVCGLEQTANVLTQEQ